MNRKFLLLSLLAFSFAFSVSAQEKAPTPPPKKPADEKETITIRKKGNGTDKMTIIVDGDHVTINGKNVEDMKGEDFEIMKEHFRSEMPKIRGRMAPLGDMRINIDGIPAESNKAFLGVGSEKNEKGAKVTSVEKESAAEKAGLKKEDIITKIGEDKISNSEDLYKAIGKYKPEDKVTVHYLRDGKESTLTASLGKNNSTPQFRTYNFNGNDFKFDMPESPRMNFNYNRKPRLGLQIQDLEDSKGVKVLDVDDESPAAKAGLKEGDVITEIDGKAVTSVEELRTKTNALKEGDSLKINYRRDGKVASTEIKFPKKLRTVDL